jgi:uncharacterized protein (TIGR02453 family)
VAVISQKSLSFLTDLKHNNNRDWFISQKKRYDEYKADYHRVIAEFLEVMKQGDPSLERLEVKQCTFRINRDIRFSKDKSPYKSHMGIWMSTNVLSGNGPGYYIHIEPGASFLSGGLYNPEAPELKKVRRELDFFHDDLEEILAEPGFKKVFGDLDRENALKTSPKDYPKDHPAIKYLQLKSFTASAPINDSQLKAKNFVSNTAAKLLLLKPLNEYLNRALTQE